MSRISVNSIHNSAILSDLKRETQACHAELERSVDFMTQVRNASGYRSLLENFYGLFCPIEADLWQFRADMVKWLPDLEPRMRSAALRADLAVLGNPRPGDLPLAPVPFLSSLPARFGCLYVLEGSTLGGQFISRHVLETLMYTPENGCAFFASHGAEVGSMWSKFRNALESYASANPGDSGEIVQSAIATFQLFRDWIETRS